MKKVLLILLLIMGIAAPSLTAQTAQSYYLISGTVSNPPPINAVTVENVANLTLNNTYDVEFDFQNLRNFANRQFITAVPGISFDNYSTTNYLRTPLDSFVNEGTILASTRLLISANTVENKDNAVLSVTRGGRIAISGNDVNLQGALIGAGDSQYLTAGIEGGFGGRVGNNYFYVNPGNVRDDYWASTNGGNISLGFMSFGGVSPSHLVNYRGNPLGFLYGQSLNVNPSSFNFGGFPTNAFYTNGYQFYASTNNYNFINNTTFRNTIQLVFIRTNQFSPAIQVAFPGSTNSAGFLMNDIVVEFVTTELDPLSGQVTPQYLTLYDESGTWSFIGSGGANNTLKLQSNDTHPGYFRPVAYSLFRGPVSFASGLSVPPIAYTNVIFPGSGNFNERFVTNLVQHQFSAWGFTVSPRTYDSTLGVDPFLSDPTNSPGRVEINANNLNLAYSTIRSDNLLTLTATNGLNLTGATLFAPNISIKVPTANNISFSNNLPDNVTRLNGQVACWTGVWQVDQRVTNSVFLPGFTGLVEHAYQILVIDNTLVTNTPVQIRDFAVKSPVVDVADGLTFNGNLNMLGDVLHVATNGSFNITGANVDFTVEDAPNLKAVINEGVFTAPGLVSFGFDRSLAYSNVFNSGNIQGGSLQVKSSGFTNSGSIITLSGGITINSTTNVITAGSLTSGAGNLDLSGNHLSVGNAQLSSALGMNLRFTNFLGDNGLTNQIIVNNGFRLLTHPNKGDLMASHIYSIAPNFQNRFHTWAGEDRGATASGFANNTAIQHLTLYGGTNSTFIFQGASTSNALYVNYLEFQGSTTNTNGVHVTSTLNINPNLTIYFADSNVPEDKLTNAFPGRLVWVDPSLTAGPMVAVPTYNGAYVTISTRSAQLMLAPGGDADGDGIENERDPSPLSGFTVSSVTVVNLPPVTAFIKWQAKAGITYTIEYRDSLDSSAWKTLYSITAQESKELTAIDVPPTGSQRYYRVRYTVAQ